MCLALVGGVAAWIISIVGLLQHRARWLLIAAGGYGIQGVSVFTSYLMCECVCEGLFKLIVAMIARSINFV